jgi:hypothetical protein
VAGWPVAGRAVVAGWPVAGRAVVAGWPVAGRAVVAGPLLPAQRAQGRTACALARQVGCPAHAGWPPGRCDSPRGPSVP